MHYFVIFNKKGIIEFEEGEAPTFLNSLIRTINIQQASGSRNIRDTLMEYKIEGQRIYLSFGNKPSLDEFIKKHKHKDSTENKQHESKGNKEIEKPVVSDTLDFSETGSNISSIIKTIRKADFKKAFSLFTGKVSIEQLQSKMIGHLIRKNVDPTFCRIITDDIISEIKSENVDMISESFFKEKVNKTLNKVIPKFDHDSFIENIKKHTGVFSICFVGVNGVGKSTTLAKIAYWLIQNGLRVYIAACDTFRAGAIEQLKVHVERFKLGGHDVGFFESGYAKDDASVAKHAIMKANSENYDVILIDTAGRMHNKEALMVSLTKLIKTSNPDHIIFVGEALIGGDSLHHIKEFNKRISEGSSGRRIDSIILTKIDTVDDKIGQVLNFTFTANSPIMFLGTGQSNTDLTIMEGKAISDILLS
ncbi:uncharacterized protein VICG_01551 [Vittaforma corneae ATCC 50505]|uniref:Signal recognition particle receptor subunit alpha homolog n=1 Tax=Vittaforma corneae (strain ATCC 50505) TaxID=993615 RepID=L2GKR4_VITCO|nr:uncharacterized protein VICG_01551 [Vittaforma corneae ATCC 50505]ELA41446.1 hypothetical protein VICG_01551 [Vittaforma corneae ATCC 50505]